MKVSFIHALDQPLKKQRLAHDLAAALDNPNYNRFYVVVAAVSQAALLRLDDRFKKWRSAGKKILAIYGVDIAATSAEGLIYSMNTFDRVYIARVPGVRFHPKMYIFKGPKHGLVFYGSNNFTVPGTELNLEACVRIEYSLPADNAQFMDQMRGVKELIAERASDTVFRLNKKVLGVLVAEGLAVPERRLGKVGESTSTSTKSPSKLPKSTLKRLPPTPMPKGLLAAVAKAKPKSPVAATPATGTSAVAVLVMQIKPHANGEIFLSKIAVDQNPGFFGWPFTGVTVPKQKGNAGYPQRVPDPVVDVSVWGSGKKPAFELSGYGLNTVYYSKNHEIRVTCAPIVSHVPGYSVMVMKRGKVGSGPDYELEIYRPDSAMYGAWVAACNQTMPSGGKKPRKFGWL